MLATAATLAGCMSGTQTVAADVSPEGWSEPVVLRHFNSDTLSAANLTLSLRHSAAVLPAAGSFIIERLSPWGEIRIDTMMVDIPPIVSNTGRLHETTVAAGIQVPFAEAGEWRFTVTPLQTMQGIWSVAIEIN